MTRVVGDVSTHWIDAPYQRGPALLQFAVAGEPVGQGSLSFKGKNRAGKAIMAPSSKYMKPWRDRVIAAIRTAISTCDDPSVFPLIGPVALDLFFTVPKPKSAPKRTRTFPIVQPDADKLARCVADAGTFAGLYGDDAQIVDGPHPWKVYPSETPRALRVPGVVGVIYQVIG